MFPEPKGDVFILLLLSNENFHVIYKYVNSKTSVHLKKEETANALIFFKFIFIFVYCYLADCTLQDFVNGDLYDRNFNTVGLQSSYSPGEEVRVGCTVGYTGFFKLQCMRGRWQAIGKACQRKSCGHPGDAQFADFILEGEDFVFGSQVVYTCHKGYQMVSRRNTRRCMEKGWDGTLPVCEALQCPVISADNNVQMIGDADEANYGNVLRFTCRSSNEILYGSQQIYCNEHGEWSDEVPKCRAITCKLPQFPVGGATYDPPFRNVFPPGGTVKITCGDNYYISRPQDISAVATCKDDGEWSFELTCREVTCNRPRDPTLYDWRNWDQRVMLRDTVRYSCRGGYKRTGGATEATCTRDGWRPNPLCQGTVTCRRKDIPYADIEGKSRQVYTYSDRVHYNCKDGREGSFSLTCGQNGWEGSEDCRECKKPDIQHGFMVGPYNETLYYTCEEGYKLVTKPWWGETKCGSKEALAQCIEESACGELPAIPHMEVESQRNNYMYNLVLNMFSSLPAILSHCAPPPKVANAVVVTSRQKEYTSGSEATYQCRDQYTIKGVATVTCINGTWGERNFTCTCTYIQKHLKLLQMLFLSLSANGNPCPNPPEVAHAVVETSDQTEYTSGSKVTYQCRDHYTMEGVGRITCINGQWEEEKFTCSLARTYIQKHLKLLQMLYERVQLVQFHSNLIFF
uniref:Complement factor H like 1 n=1 Tax=Seriola dumerili TaxID=41447 RepID=A0A3B4VIA0_SERDU